MSVKLFLVLFSILTSTLTIAKEVTFLKQDLHRKTTLECFGENCKFISIRIKQRRSSKHRWVTLREYRKVRQDWFLEAKERMYERYLIRTKLIEPWVKVSDPLFNCLFGYGFVSFLCANGLLFTLPIDLVKIPFVGVAILINRVSIKRQIRKMRKGVDNFLAGRPVKAVRIGFSKKYLSHVTHFHESLYSSAEAFCQSHNKRYPLPPIYNQLDPCNMPSPVIRWPYK